MSMSSFKKTPSIFICYRRGDADTEAWHLHQHLVEHFGEQALFLDVAKQTENVAQDVRSAVKDYLARCDVFFALVGSNWSAERLFDEHDFLVLELEQALENSATLVVPVIVSQGAVWPMKKDLPKQVSIFADHGHMELVAGPTTDYDGQLLEIVGLVVNHMKGRTRAPGVKTTSTMPFLQGLGIPSDTNLDDQNYVEMGRVLRLLIDNLRISLYRLSEFKSMSRLPMELIQATGNNPLKVHSDSEEVVLNFLSDDLSNAFLSPIPAVEEAISDLEVHIRAMTEILIGPSIPEQLRPENIENKLPKKLMHFTPTQRQAACWVAYQELSDQWMLEERGGDDLAVSYESITERIKHEMG